MKKIIEIRFIRAGIYFLAFLAFIHTIFLIIYAVLTQDIHVFNIFDILGINLLWANSPDSPTTIFPSLALYVFLYIGIYKYSN